MYGTGWGSRTCRAGITGGFLREIYSLNNELLKARLNLCAVLRNLEDLPELDADAADMIRTWRLAVCFSVHGGPAATLEFSEGRCRYYAACPPHPDVKLFFLSPSHLNGMFAGDANPVPLKGLSKLRFLKHEFIPLTRRLEYFLRPAPETLAESAGLRAHALLTLLTGVFSVPHLAALDSIAAEIAAATPCGSLQFVVDSEGPIAHLMYDGDRVEAQKGPLDRPSALMWFADWPSAYRVLSGRLDAFTAAGKGLLRLDGTIPLIDNTCRIMDRAAGYLA